MVRICGKPELHLCGELRERSAHLLESRCDTLLAVAALIRSRVMNVQRDWQRCSQWASRQVNGSYETYLPSQSRNLLQREDRRRGVLPPWLAMQRIK